MRVRILVPCLVPCLFLGLVGLAGACGADDDPPAAAASLDALQQASGSRWRAVLRPDRSSITFLAREQGALSVATVDATPSSGETLATAPGKAATFLRDWPGLFGASARPDTLQLVEVGGDDLGGARVRFQLFAAGLPIEGSQAVVVVDAGGRARAVAGAFPATSELAARPTVARLDAIAAARAQLAAEAPGASLELDGEPELAASLVNGELRPIWRITLRAEQTDQAPTMLLRELHVDAATGQVVRERDAVWSVAVTGSGVGVDGRRRDLEVSRRSDGLYVLRDETRPPAGIRTYTAEGRTHLPGELVTSFDPDAWDEEVLGAGAAVDAHANAGVVYDYLGAALGRKSIDGKDGGIRLVVHHGRDEANAFWDGHRAVFGDGDDHVAPLSGALDVVAHELFHAVTQRDAGLVYEGESGALNESISDVFACFVERRQGGGDWTIAEDVASPPFRDLARPSRLGLPAHMSEYVDLPLTPAGDMGGVHINSTIPSHAAYLVTVDLGRKRTERIWYRAVRFYLTPYARFADFAEATFAAAEDLYGGDSEETRAVEQAWREVGVWP